MFFKHFDVYLFKRKTINHTLTCFPFKGNIFYLNYLVCVQIILKKIAGAFNPPRIAVQYVQGVNYLRNCTWTVLMYENNTVSGSICRWRSSSPEIRVRFRPDPGNRPWIWARRSRCTGAWQISTCVQKENSKHEGCKITRNVCFSDANRISEFFLGGDSKWKTADIDCLVCIWEYINAPW